MFEAFSMSVQALGLMFCLHWLYCTIHEASRLPSFYCFFTSLYIY